MKIELANTMLSNEITRVSKPGLERVHELLYLCGNPQIKLKILHIVGTNGKGSVTTMLESIYCAAGYKTGVMRSPCMEGPYDYYRIGGQLADEDLYSQCVTRVCEKAAQMKDSPSEFELSTVVGLLMFAESNCNIVFLEAGMGGANDATHVTRHSLLTVVTHIAVDHAEWLGSDRATILREKMLIAGPEDFVLLGPNDSEIQNAALEIANEEFFQLTICRETPVLNADGTFTYRNISGLKLGLRGAYQKENMVTVLETVTLLSTIGYPVDTKHIITGLANASLPYRFQIIREHPYLILDGGHNPDCMKALRASLEQLEDLQPLSVVTAVMRDKEYDQMYPEIDGFADEYLAVTAPNPRSFPAPEFAEWLKRFNKPVTAASDFSEAAAWIEERINNNKPVLIAGSLYMMTAIYHALQEREII